MSYFSLQIGTKKCVPSGSKIEELNFKLSGILVDEGECRQFLLEYLVLEPS